MGRLAPQLLSFVCILVWLQPAAAQDRDLLETARSQLQQMNERGALKTLEAAKVKARNSPDDLALVHLYTGLAHAGMADKTNAMKSFEAALVLQPNLELPTWVSPVVGQWWERAGGKMPKSVDAPTLTPPLSAPPMPGVETAPGVTTAPENKVESSPQTQRGWSGLRWAGIGLAAVAAASLGVAIAQGQRAENLAQKAQMTTTVNDALAIRRGAETSALTANSLYIGAGVLATTGILLFFIWP